MVHRRHDAVICGLAVILSVTAVSAAQVSGELRKWHKVTLTFDGPETGELVEPNSFLYYRLDVAFRHEVTDKDRFDDCRGMSIIYELELARRV